MHVLHGLCTTHPLTSLAEWQFIQGLAYPSQLRSTPIASDTEAQSPAASSSQSRTSPEAEFIRLIYTARLRKYHHLEEHAAVRTKLVEEVLTALRRCKPRGVIDDIASMHWAITPTCCLALQMLYTHDQDGPIASSSPSGQRFNYLIYRVLKLTSPTTEYAHSWTSIPRLCHYT